MSSIDVHGISLEIRQIKGKGGGKPTLVFLHHGLGCVELWRDFPDRLCEITGCPGLIYSRIGHGKSSPTPWPRPLSFLEDQGRKVLPALLEALDINDTILVGHSEGATISLVYAGAIGKGVRCVVAEAPHLVIEPDHITAIDAAKVDFANGKLRDQLARYHGENIDCCFRGWSETWLQPIFEKWSIEHQVPKIRCPVLAIRGESDEQGSDIQIERLKSLCKSDLTVVIPPAGHAPHEETPDEMLDLMTKFITPHLG